VFSTIEKERVRIGKIRKRQGEWIGHMLRGDSLLGAVIKGIMEGRKQEEDQAVDSSTGVNGPPLVTLSLLC